MHAKSPSASVFPEISSLLALNSAAFPQNRRFRNFDPSIFQIFLLVSKFNQKSQDGAQKEEADETMVLVSVKGGTRSPKSLNDWKM